MGGRLEQMRNLLMGRVKVTYADWFLALVSLAAVTQSAPSPTRIKRSQLPEPANYDIRLIDGYSENEGRVEIFHNGRWGTICDRGWGMNEASVVCRELGFPSAIKSIGAAKFGEGKGPIFMDGMTCKGSESRLEECPRYGISDCTHPQDAGVVCAARNSPPGEEGEVRLDGKDNRGHVTLYHEGKWRKICDDQWDNSAARIVCVQLGYVSGYAPDAPYWTEFGPSWLCQGNEKKLVDCLHNNWGMDECGHVKHAMVECHGYSPSHWKRK